MLAILNETLNMANIIAALTSGRIEEWVCRICLKLNPRYSLRDRQTISNKIVHV